MITQCRSCKSRNLVDAISVGRQYLSDFRTDSIKPDQYPLDLTLCANCSLLQLKESPPPEKMYTDNYGYKSGINNTIKADLKDIVEKAVAKVPLPHNEFDVVVDIGANDGTLLSNYDQSKFTRVGIDPLRKFAKELSNHADHVITDFFNYEAYKKVMGDKKAKIITFISCFYDLEDPNKVVSDLVKILDLQGILVIEQNYLVGMLKQNAFDNIVHEHLEYYTLTSLEYLLNKHGLEVFEAEENDINGGAFRVYVRHMSNLDKMRYAENKMKLGNKFTYMLFNMKIQGIRTKIHKFISEEVAKGKTIYMYGASTRGNSLIQYFDLNNKLIKAAVERNPEKVGKKIASLQIPIISEEQARKDKPDYMLVAPWFFKKEFIEREKEYLDSGGHFIFPLPEMEVV